MSLTTSIWLIAGCGGGSKGAIGASEFALRVEADAEIAGIEWTMSPSFAAQDRQLIMQKALSAFGAGAQVLSRNAPKGLNAQEWIVLSGSGAALAKLDLIQKQASSKTSLPAVSAVMCADARGNPVNCVLRWEAM